MNGSSAHKAKRYTKSGARPFGRAWGVSNVGLQMRRMTGEARVLTNHAVLNFFFGVVMFSGVIVVVGEFSLFFVGVSGGKQW